MLRLGSRTFRRLSTAQSSPQSEEGRKSWASTRNGLWEMVFIGGTGAFGVYEIYKGMFLLPQHEPTKGEIANRLARRKVQVFIVEEPVVAPEVRIEVPGIDESAAPPVTTPVPNPKDIIA